MVSGQICKICKMVCVMLSTTLGLATAGAAEEAKLGARHIDPVNGFSLCPPAGVELIRGVGKARLAKWVMRDAKTGAIAWQLIVSKEYIQLFPKCPELKGRVSKLLKVLDHASPFGVPVYVTDTGQVIFISINNT